MKNYQRNEVVETMINYDINAFTHSSLKTYLEKIGCDVVVEKSSHKCLVRIEYSTYNRDKGGNMFYEYIAKPYRNKYRIYKKLIKDIAW